MDNVAEPIPARFVEIYDVRFRLWPIVAAGLIIEPMLMAGREPARWIFKNAPIDLSAHPWIFVTLAVAFQALVGLLALQLMRKALPRAESHLRWPPGRSYVVPALGIGIGMGLVMLTVDYWPNLIGNVAPSDYAVDPLNAAGWLLPMATTGLAEETIFRGFLVGALAILVPGRVRIGRFDLPLAAYIVAILFALTHWRSFVVDPLHAAIGQQTYAILWALVYAWLMERSRSLLAPIVAHGTGNAVEVGLVIAWRIAAT